MKQLIIIPARMGSKRLKNKPMINLKGKTMIERTFLQCAKAFDRNLIYVATDSITILNHCKKKNMNCILTSKNCLTGTDRVAEVANKIKVDSYINVQGDEPIFNPTDIKKLVKISKKYPDSILNGYCEISNIDLYKSVNIPKVVFSKNNNLLYMSRSPIPGNKKSIFKKAYRQVCAYVFPRPGASAIKAVPTPGLIVLVALSVRDSDVLRTGIPLKPKGNDSEGTSPLSNLSLMTTLT